ncbi:MAG TPA: 3-oxoacyl-[acyl-carrier-protein] reductase [Candidatus Polarisedimenticolia bacterium]|nr:3-oxoacyl-[acyl-carrier-protein] reductase [Candidatus Polarisedimenticolia bacterium]
MSFEGRVTLVTGASRGIGHEIALLLAGSGSDLLLVARSRGDLERTCEECTATGVRAEALVLDLADPVSLEAGITEGIGRFGRVDHLVNNAGMTRDGLLVRMKRPDWDAVLAVNLTAAFVVTKCVVPMMMKARYGRIVNVSSVVALMGNPGQANYCASKAGLIGFTHSLARELASRSITVNAVAPGFIETAMTADLPPAAREALLSQVPLRRLGTPRDVAESVRFLLSEEAGYVTGTVLNVSGGLHME